MIVEQGPITTWPGERTPPHRRERARFDTPHSKTLRELASELEKLRATSVRIEIAIPPEGWRLDGRPRAGARADHPGVVVRADTRYGPISYATDRFTRYEDNLRAIALGLGDLRRLERYGIANRGQQYRGWTALEAGRGDPSPGHGRGIIAEHGSVAAALKATHPDHGGDPDDFADVQAARAAGVT